MESGGFFEELAHERELRTTLEAWGWDVSDRAIEAIDDSIEYLARIGSL